MKENFRPISNTAPSGVSGSIKFYARFIFDLQNFSIYIGLKRYLRPLKGRILDMGCGDSPYRHLLNGGCEYIGADIEGQKSFDYDNCSIIRFKGGKLPLKNLSVDHIICTEVLEHVESFGKFVWEMRRVLKKGGTAFVTVPWSARYHYVPYDFFRYTPAALAHIFGDFSSVEVVERGTDITSICSKIIVACARCFTGFNAVKIILLPVSAVLALPLLAIAVIIGHLSLAAGLGSRQDPLGYTIFLKK
jgi:SAM-dependent methyltransferase